MDLFMLGAGIYMAGHGGRGLPGGALIGSIAMIFGGLLVIVGAII
jgi:hypothetical protein